MSLNFATYMFTKHTHRTETRYINSKLENKFLCIQLVLVDVDGLDQFTLREYPEKGESGHLGSLLLTHVPAA